MKHILTTFILFSFLGLTACENAEALRAKECLKKQTKINYEQEKLRQALYSKESPSTKEMQDFNKRKLELKKFCAGM